MDIGNPFLLVSAERASLGTEQNRQRSAFLLRQIQRTGAPYLTVKGCYRGSQERSYLVWGAEGTPAAEELERLAFQVYDQDSVMYVDANRAGYLVFSGGGRKAIGTWRQSTGTSVAWTETPDGTRWIAA